MDRNFYFNPRHEGQYFDEESGLHENWHRSYDPQTGRYTSADPIGLAGGWNRFGYVEGNPVWAVDPEGLWELSVQFFAPFGFGISFGKDEKTCQGFMTAKFGVGIGGGISYNPEGTRPRDKNAVAGRGGITVGGALEAGIGGSLGAWGVNASVSGRSGYDFGNQKSYKDLSPGLGIGNDRKNRSSFDLGFGGFANIELGIYDKGRKECECK